jgi:hypothetical protein
MDDKELQKIQDEILSGLDKEQKIEENIVQSADEIASHLLISKKVNAEINDTQYMITYRLLNSGKKQYIFMVVANINKFKIAGSSYKPYTATAEMDTRYSEHDNIKATVEAFIRHVTGRIKPETLEGE